MAKEKSWGIERIICTPHITQDTFENTPQTIGPAFQALKKAVENLGIDISLEYSAEHRLDNFFSGQLEKGLSPRCRTISCLLRTHLCRRHGISTALLFDLALKGFRPILAHPERYSYYYDKPQRYEQLHTAGTLFQINLLSLAGYYGKSEKKTAEWLIEKGFADFVGTDMHNMRHCEAIEAYIGSKDYYRHAKALKSRLFNDKVFEAKP